jgi:hypothetical protein
MHERRIKKERGAGVRILLPSLKKSLIYAKI